MDNNKDLSRDRQFVAGNQDWEVEHVAEKFNVSIEVVKKAIEQVGNKRVDVEELLKANAKY